MHTTLADIRIRLIPLLLAGVLLGGCTSVSHVAVDTDTRDTASTAALRQEASEAMQRGEMGVALASLRAALAREPENIETLHLTAGLYESVGNDAGRRDTYERILTLSPDDVDILESIGLLSLQQGSLSEAEDYLRRAVELAPQRWGAWNGLGVLEDTRGNYATAQAHFRRGLELVPGHPKLTANLGWSKLLAGDHAEAERNLRKALSVSPSITTSSNLALSIALQGRYQEALKLYRSLYAESVATNNVGYAALVRGDRIAARRFLNDAIASKPSFYDKAATNLRLITQAE